MKQEDKQKDRVKKTVTIEVGRTQDYEDHLDNRFTEKKICEVVDGLARG